MKKFIKSFKYAFEGIFTGIKKERNMKIHISIMILVIIFGILLKINKVEWIICITLFGLVISMELINTAIESTVDLITKKKKRTSQNSKRCCSRCSSYISNCSRNNWTNDICTKNIINFVSKCRKCEN